MPSAGPVMARDPYEVLGVRPEASEAAIKAAYKRMARATHPDSGGEAFAFRAIQEAFDLLEDPNRRAAFDATPTDTSQEPPPTPHRSKPPPSQHSYRRPSRPSPPSDLASPSWVGQIPDIPATVTPGRGVDWAERAVMPVCAMLLLLAAAWAPITGSGPLWTLGFLVYVVVAMPWRTRVPMHRRLVAPGLLWVVATIAWTVLLPSTLTTGQVLTVVTPPVLTLILAIAGTAWLRAWLAPARQVTITAARRFNAFWPAGTITPDNDIADFANLFTTIPSARLIHEHRGARTWVLVGDRAVAFTEASTVDLSGIARLDVRVYSYERHLLSDLQSSLESIGAWLLEAEGGGLVVDRRQLGILAS